MAPSYRWCQNVINHLLFWSRIAMQNNEGRKTEQAYWEAGSNLPIKARLPSRLNVDVLNVTRLLERHVRPGSRYIEIGCAPGKLLAWVASVLKAEATGLDYSAPGIAKCRMLFDALELKINLYHDDFFNHHLLPAYFDVVTSFGFIEHFDDARPVVRKHLDLVKPGGVALIAVPNYGGIYGSLQRWCDSSNLELHNLEIMNPCALTALVDSLDVESMCAYPFGAMSPWLLNLDKRLPRSVAKLVSLGVNAMGLLQPLTLGALAPLLVLEVRKGPVT
jgi:2-polyprenyl-3-methyl-5-hydroxy-6-metoxy-1,4-benzoquinol methylase